jgi:peptidoglycan/xylan/chitin deacetylase (PgdA/CDA1 family)
MRIISPFLKSMVYPTLSMGGAFRRISAPGLAVVTYHGVFPEGYNPVDRAFDGNLVSAKAFRRQLRRLKTNYRVISPRDVLAWRQGQGELPPRAVLLTCDDGLLNNLTDMLPILLEEGLQCLFFVTGASSREVRTMLWYEELFLLLLQAKGPFEVLCDGIKIGGDMRSRESRRSCWWSCVQQLSQLDAESRSTFLSAVRKRLASDLWRGFDAENSISCRRFGLMTAGELRQLASSGMTIGAHSMTHPILSRLPLDLALGEVAESRASLESTLDKKVWAFAYPFGDAQSVTWEVLALPERAGYQAAFLNFGGGLGVPLPVYALPRVHVTVEMRLSELEAHVSGFHGQLRRQARLNEGALGAKAANH